MPSISDKIESSRKNLVSDKHSSPAIGERELEMMDKRFSQLQWTMGLGFTILAALMGVFNFF